MLHIENRLNSIEDTYVTDTYVDDKFLSIADNLDRVSDRIEVLEDNVAAEVALLASRLDAAEPSPSHHCWAHLGDG